MGAISFSLNQHFTDFVIQLLGLNTFVETGTFKGDTVEAVRTKFKRIYSIELSQDLFNQAKDRFTSYEHIVMKIGDSAALIQEIQAMPEFSNYNTLYWLDAHWCAATSVSEHAAQCPLLAEIRGIGSLNENSLIVIDDARLFLAPPYGHNNYSARDWPKFHEVLSALSSISNRHQIMICDDIIIFYPARVEGQMFDYWGKHGSDLLSIADKARGYDADLAKTTEKTEENERLGLRTLEILRTQNKLQNQLSLAGSVVNRLKKKMGLLKYPPSQTLKDSPLVSIVIPTFNQGPFIRDCLNSIQGQSYKNFEVIIQDSLSTDQTQEICLEFEKSDSRFRYFRQKDLGQTDAINRGLSKSFGAFWTWICSDDRYHSNQSLESLVSGFVFERNRDPGVLGVFGNAFYISEGGEPLHNFNNLTRSLSVKDFQENWPLSQPASILLKEKVLELGGLDPELHLGMDLDLFINVLKNGGRFAYISADVADIRLQENSKSVKYRTDTAITALRIVKKHFGSIGRPRRSAYSQELMASIDQPSYEEYLVKFGISRLSLAYQRHGFKFSTLTNFSKRVLRFLKRKTINFAKMIVQR